MEEAILFKPSQHSYLLPSIASLHMECITHDHTLATFLPPLSYSKVLKMWQDCAADVESGSRHIIMVLAPPNSASSSAEVAGVVMLNMPFAETGPFRAEVLKLFTSPNHRQKGVAKRLMVKLEEVARKDGRALLMLDTETGSLAELVYPRLGYTRIGVIEDFGISPKDGRLVAETFFYKDLRKSEVMTI